MRYIKITILILFLFSVCYAENSIVIYYSGKTISNTKVLFKNLKDNSTNYVSLPGWGGLYFSSQTVVSSSTTYSINAYINFDNVDLLDYLCRVTTNYLEATKTNINKAVVVRRSNSTGIFKVNTIWEK